MRAARFRSGPIVERWQALTRAAGRPAAAGSAAGVGCVAEPLEGRAMLALVSFAIDPALSAVAVSGNAAGSELQAQGPGALTTTYGGTLLADVNSQSITLPGGSSITANNNGNWRPDETGNRDASAPANYGARVTQAIFFTTYAAIRNLALDVTTASAQPFGAGGAFASGAETFTTTAGRIDYNVAVPAMVGSEPLAGQSGNNQAAAASTYTVSNGIATLTIPIDATLTLSLLAENDSQITLRGQIVARGAAPVVSVAGRHVFYNNSVFDGNSAAADANDDGAIDPAKSPLPAGGTPGPANVTSYTKGVNGLLIDVANLAPDGPANLGLNDVSVRTTSPAAPNTFSAGPAPASVTVRPGAGAGGSDRVTVIWADGAITNRWVEVTLLANADTDLAAPDVLRIGNLVGDADGSRTVNLGDFGALRQAFGQGATPDARADFNRDGTVNLADFGTLRSNFSRSLPLPPAAAPSPTADLLSADDDEEEEHDE